MTSKNFFHNTGPYKLAEILEHCGLKDHTDHLDHVIQDVAGLDEATEGDISFLDNVKYKENLTKTKAGFVIVHPEMREFVPKHSVAVISQEPYKTYAMTASLFYPESISHSAGRGGDTQRKTIIHTTAVIHESAVIGKGCHIGPYVVVEENVNIGDNTLIEASTMITKNCKIGKYCHIGSHCSINVAEIGHHVRIHNGARIGQDGFGFAFSETGFIPVPQLGAVIIHDRVNIGANTTIDRGSGPNTVIGAGTIIDNLVQIAHNVQIGSGSIIVAQVGISGSTKIGNYCILAGQVGVIGHLDIGDGVKIGAQSGVSKSVPANTDIMGSPAQEKRAYWRELATLRKLSSGGITRKTNNKDNNSKKK